MSTTLLRNTTKYTLIAQQNPKNNDIQKAKTTLKSMRTFHNNNINQKAKVLFLSAKIKNKIKQNKIKEKLKSYS